MNGSGISAIAWMLLAMVCSTSYAGSTQNTVAQEVTVTILSSNLANGATIGEWGFSALVEVDGRCVLFDAGWHVDTVLRNIEVLNIDLSCVTDVVLSHFHDDHTTGLIPIVEHTRAANPDAMQRVHVAEGIFLPRRRPAGAGYVESNNMRARRDALEAIGVVFIEHSGPTEVLPGVWVTGPVARNHPERNYSTSSQMQVAGEWVVDYVPESQGLTVVTANGPIVLLGCGHSGTVNMLDQVQSSIQNKSIHALMGGMHLFAADDQTLGWTADRLRVIGVDHLMAGHCTGIEPMFRLRAGLNLSRQTAVIGAVGSRFVYGEGIHPTAIAQ
ncbi:MAG: MBL fold metallo-hydrolase [Gammaproteobacteria bacterium]|nr:MBL fold metallo-hydrolase [Gammaproteobacteria bacterium]